MKFEDLIKQETLATKIVNKKQGELVDLNNHEATIDVEKI